MNAPDNAKRPFKILTLGHSLAVDSCHMLNLVAATEGFGRELIIGTLYYSGCRLSRHVEFLTENKDAYNLYLSSSATPEQPPLILKKVTMEYALKYDAWDMIIMQGGVFEMARDDTFADDRIETVINYVNANKTNPEAVFAWHMPWATPIDHELRDKYPYTPNSYYTSYEAFGDDRLKLFGIFCENARKHILTNPIFVRYIPTGAAFQNALTSIFTEKDLHRDYAHATDLGRLMAAYTWYGVLAGVKAFDRIKVDAIPMAFLRSTADKTQDRPLTEQEKLAMVEAVNNALSNPLAVTRSKC